MAIYKNYNIDNRRKRDWANVLIAKIVEKYLKRNAIKVMDQGIPQIFIVSQDHVSNRVLLNGIYERGYLDCAMNLLRKNDRINGSAVDAGANIGNHSLFFSQFYDQTFAFEPNPKVFKILSANANLVNNMQCFELGLSNIKNSENLTIIDGYNLGSATMNPDEGNSGAKEISINTVRLDQCENIMKNKIGLVKIDVENFEINVIEGSEALLLRDSPIVFFEQQAAQFPSSGEDSECVKALRKSGYSHFYEIDIYPCFPKIK